MGQELNFVDFFFRSCIHYGNSINPDFYLIFVLILNYASRFLKSILKLAVFLSSFKIQF